MKSFRTWIILEKVYKNLKVKTQWSRGEIVDQKVYINPTKAELKLTASGSRGVIDRDGNLILFGWNREFIHEDIIEVLKPILKLGGGKYDWNEITFNKLGAVAVQREKDTIAVAESQRPIGFDDADSWEFGDDLFKKAAKKNPALKFEFRSVRQIR